MIKNCDCIVSLTSWKGRIYNPVVSKAIFSIINQKTKYNYKIVLVLSKIEFPNGLTDLPESIKLFNENNLIEILWTEDNLKAYKKTFPVMEKYPNLPIMTTDDDIFLNEKCVETFMNMHNKVNNAILAEHSHSKICSTEIIPYMFRLFPPNSLYKLPSYYFSDIYKGCDDDVYISVLAKIKGTKIITLNSGLAKEFTGEIQENALHNIYTLNSAKENRKRLINKLKEDKIIQ